MLIDTILFLFGSLVFFIMLYMSFISFKEDEPRAAKIALFLGIVLSIPYFTFSFITFPYKFILVCCLITVPLIIAFILLFPTKKRKNEEIKYPDKRIDERDIMFSRNLQKKGTERFNEYYKQNPHYKKADDFFRTKPGLLKKDSIHYNPFTFAAAEASFKTVSFFHNHLEKRQLNENKGNCY